MIEEIKKESARILLETDAVLFNIEKLFTYTSGRTGPVYIDCRRLISFPAHRKRLMDMGAEIIRTHCPQTDVIAGGESAGIPYAAFLAERLNLPMIYVRKKPKGFGRMAQIEGMMKEGQNFLIAEDVQNFGASISIFVEALRKAGAIVENAFVIFEHGHEQSRRVMTDLGVTLHSLCSWPDIMDAARKSKKFDTSTLEYIESFLHNPENWMKSA